MTLDLKQTVSGIRGSYLNMLELSDVIGISIIEHLFSHSFAHSEECIVYTDTRRSDGMNQCSRVIDTYPFKIHSHKLYELKNEPPRLNFGC